MLAVRPALAIAICRFTKNLVPVYSFREREMVEARFDANHPPAPHGKVLKSVRLQYFNPLPFLENDAMSETLSSGTRNISEVATKSGALALALGAIAASTGAAHASVVVTQVDPGVDVSSGSATIYYPTTGGTAAYTLSASTISTAGGSSNLIETNPGNTAAAAKLSAGTVIGPSSFSSPGTSSTTADLGIPFKGPYYIGLDVVTSPTVNNYGWAYITPGTPTEVTSGLAAVTSASPFPDPVVSAYAFQTTPNTPITTPSPVPEPSSLALLAVGAAGVLRMRRRAKVVADA